MRQHCINEPDSVEFDVFLQPVKETRYLNRTIPSGILLSNHRLHSGIVSGQFVYEPIG